MNVYVVVIRTNLDDVIAGTYHTLGEARRRLRLLSSPEMAWEELQKNTMDTADSSGLIGVAIYRSTGDKVERVEQTEIEEELPQS